MEQILLLVLILAVLIVVTNLFQKDRKPVGSCKTCPEYRYCGGGKPRCPRRSENRK